ncbi:hypothetical protein MOQ72_32175 [Saccharopolyspora sp. K220]|uniref:hypothetical protein n=1 Tax=Saccharopolyspora soli TaxID=2926618 RepID=UPI001F5850DA|nr:hypothetical protein [Saccharopolyspora soli]MCI2422100.1 hypothetical protein [Saccharopolyspora soli]
MSHYVHYETKEQGRWPGLVDIIRAVGPDVLLVHEVDWLADPDEPPHAETQLDMHLAVTPSKHPNTAAAGNPTIVSLVDGDTKHSLDLHHGYCAPHHEPSPPRSRSSTQRPANSPVKAPASSNDWRSNSGNETTPSTSNTAPATNRE